MAAVQNRSSKESPKTPLKIPESIVHLVRLQTKGAGFARHTIRN